VGSVDLSLPNRFLLFAADTSATGHGVSDLLNNIGLCVIVAAILAFIANKLKQPAILAYLLAGVLIGPEIGFRLITDHETIEIISEVGLILLLFIIGALVYRRYSKTNYGKYEYRKKKKMWNI
jgi:hypothetical protein